MGVFGLSWGIRGDSGTSDIRALIRFGQVICELFHKYFKTVLIRALSLKSRLPTHRPTLL